MIEQVRPNRHNPSKRTSGRKHSQSSRTGTSIARYLTSSYARSFVATSYSDITLSERRNAGTEKFIITASLKPDTSSDAVSGPNQTARQPDSASDAVSGRAAGKPDSASDAVSGRAAGKPDSASDAASGMFYPARRLASRHVCLKPDRASDAVSGRSAGKPDSASDDVSGLVEMGAWESSKEWLGYRDSNPDSWHQKPESCHWTIPQREQGKR